VLGLILPQDSLTQKWIINPILQKRAYAEINRSVSFSQKFIIEFQGSIVSRIMALFSSFITLLDASTHLFLSITKGLCWGLRKVSLLEPLAWRSQEVFEHFKRSMFFIALSLIASVIGVVWPSFFQHIYNIPKMPLAINPKRNALDSHILQTYLKQAPETVQLLVLKIFNSPTINDSNFHLNICIFKEFWLRSSLQERCYLVHVFNLNHPKFDALRDWITNTREIDGSAAASALRLPNAFSIPLQNPAPLSIYREINYSKDVSKEGLGERVYWLSPRQIYNTCLLQPVSPSMSSSKIQAVASSFFFHAANESVFKQILKKHHIPVNFTGALKGAFVSTKPTLNEKFPFVLALKQNIERLSPLNSGFYALDSSACESSINNEHCHYWAGFSKAIPININSLACIIINQSCTEHQRKQIALFTKRWVGDSLEVFKMDEFLQESRRFPNLHRGIPAEWPEHEAAKAVLFQEWHQQS
jgi:hypothetical protein